MRAYEYEHTVGSEERNLIGNVSFAPFVSWQGRCREMFLRDHAPSVVDDLARDLRLVTTHVSCDYYAEVRALERITVRMTLERLEQGRVVMAFAYLRGDELVARGRQQIACLQAHDETHVPVA